LVSRRNLKLGWGRTRGGKDGRGGQTASLGPGMGGLGSKAEKKQDEKETRGKKKKPTETGNEVWGGPTGKSRKGGLTQGLI